MALQAKDLMPGERIVLQLREHVKAMIGRYLIGLVLLAAAAAAIYFLADPLPLAAALAACVVLAIPLVVLPWLRWRTNTFTVTNQRIAERSGIFRRKGRDIPINRINSVSMEKDVNDRFFRCGSLLVADASEKTALRMEDVPRVEQVHRVIQELIWSKDKLA